MNPSCKPTPFAPEMWHVIRGKNQYVYVMWPFQRGWPLDRVALKTVPLY